MLGQRDFNLIHAFDIRPYVWALALGLTLGAATMLSPIAGIALIVLAAGLVITLQNPLLLTYALIFATVIFSGMPRGSLIPMFIPNEPVLAGVVALGALIVILRQTTQRTTPGGVVASTIIFALGTIILPIIIYMLRGFSFGIADIFGLVAPLQFVAIMWLFANLPKNDNERMRIIQVMFLAATFVAFTAMLEAGNVGFMRTILDRFYPNIHTETAAEHGRVVSILGAWNSLGNFLMIVLIMIVMMFDKTKVRLYQINMAICALLSLFALVASGSFASIGGFVIALIITRIFDRTGLDKLGYIVGGLILVGVIMYPIVAPRLAYQFEGSNSTDDSILPSTFAYRLKVWETVFFPALERNNNFLYGITPNLVGGGAGIFRWGWTENQYLYLLVRSGLVSLVAHFIWVVAFSAWLYGKLRREKGMGQGLAIGLFALFITLTIMGMTNEVFTNSGSMDYFWMLLGLTLKSGSQEPQETALVKT
jgi:hypothetical protein